jgi:hypothetical protein
MSQRNAFRLGGDDDIEWTGDGLSARARAPVHQFGIAQDVEQCDTHAGRYLEQRQITLQASHLHRIGWAFSSHQDKLLSQNPGIRIETSRVYHEMAAAQEN